MFLQVPGTPQSLLEVKQRLLKQAIAQGEYAEALPPEVNLVGEVDICVVTEVLQHSLEGLEDLRLVFVW